MAQLNFPDPNDSQTYIKAGITWTWNPTLEVWSSDKVSADADDLYLSKVTDDTAAGEITFEGQTTHEDGVSVTGGSLDSTAVFHNSGVTYYPPENEVFNYQSQTGTSTVQTRVTLDGTKTVLTSSSNKNYHAFISQNVLRESSTIESYTGFNSSLLTGAGSIDFTGEVSGFHASDSLATKNLGTSYGFVSDLSGSGNYNFYARGDAPNFFEGILTVNGSSDSSNFRIVDNGKLFSKPTYDNNATQSTNYLRITSAGLIQRSTSSRRYKDNIRDCTLFDGTAATSVKQLQPRMWEDHKSGETVCGFVAEELYELGGEHMVSFSPWSQETSEGREYRIGNGSAPVTRDAVPMSDDVEVIDGINDRSLVILLTKALQEALEEIDSLKARLDAGGL